MEQFIIKLKNLCKTQPDLALFGMFVFLLPFGTQHFLSVLLPYSDNVFNIWSAAFVYLSDLLLVACIVAWLVRVFKRRFVLANHAWIIWLALLIFTSVLVISSVINPQPQLSWYGAARWIEVFLLCGYVLSVVVTWRRRFMVGVLFFAAVSVQAIVAVLQFLNQQSLGLKWLGESNLSTSIPNVAEIMNDGFTWLRAYGTQPHPNVLAYLLVISLIFGIYLYARVKSTSWRVAISALTGLQIMALIMTFSRTAWLGLLIGVGALIILCITWRGPRPWIHRLSIRALYPLIITGIITCASLITLWPLILGRLTTEDANGDQAATYRRELNLLGWDRFASHPIFGIGPKQFVPSMVAEQAIITEPWKFQPVHNGFLLLLVENGIGGFFAFGIIIMTKFYTQGRRLKNVPRGTFFDQNTDVLYVFIISSTVLASLFMMLFDHYILDIQQSSLTFWLLLGL